MDPLTCSTIYISSADKGAIRSRFADLARLRHTIFPLGWEWSSDIEQFVKAEKPSE